MRHLQNSKSYYIKNQQLFIVGKDKKVHLVFEAREGQPQAPIRSLSADQQREAQINGLFYLMDKPR
jgi:hypothetical protein